MQRWPDVPNAPQIEPSTALSMSASSITMMAFLPPISSEQIALRSAHADATRCPVSVEPVNEISRTEGWSQSLAPITEPWPITRFTTPGGMPASSHAFTRLKVDSGVSSAGFMTTVLPQTSAGISFHDGIAIGKFQGVINPHSPIG